MRLLVQHRSHYGYSAPATLGSHTIRLRPASHARARIETYRLAIAQDHTLRWQQDPYGNHIARIHFAASRPVDALDILVELAVDIHPVNPFDFLLEEYAERVPFAYPVELVRELAPFLSLDDPAFATGERFASFHAELPVSGSALELVTAINVAVNRRVAYVIREEAGVYTPEQCLVEGRASCRDSAVLLAALLRRRGLAARFVSGYLVQLADEGMLPDQPRGVGQDVVDLHAWCEVFLPGAGWIGLDATSGLFCGEGHLPLACASSPSQAAPIDGTSNVRASNVEFAMRVERLGHEARPTAPFTPAVWFDMVAAGERVDAALAAAGEMLTMGGEPTFNARERTDAPEWNGAALGEHKIELGRLLAAELRRRLMPGALLLERTGKWYPGESLPRWAIDVIGRADGTAVWMERPELAAGEAGRVGPLLPRAAAGDRGAADVDRIAAQAERFARALVARLDVNGGLQPAFEDPWVMLTEESRLPLEVDAHRAELTDPEARRRLARVLTRGPNTVAGWVVPLAPSVEEVAEGEAASTGDPDRGWLTERWTWRREQLFLLPGDSPVGLRLPLASLPPAPPPPPDEEPAAEPPDPRRSAELADIARRRKGRGPRPPGGLARDVRTALCVEARDGRVRVFLPPVPSGAWFLALIAAIDLTRVETGVDVELEGYPPPHGRSLRRFAITPDPGVLEVNLPPTASMTEYAALVDEVFAGALAVGLHAEKYLVDGRMAGSGGGNHITLGGPSPLASPFIRRPELLASLIRFVHNHPALSYMFAGLFVGPTSQAPRVDEARHDSLDELDIALARAERVIPDEPAEPWLTDALFRHLMVDVTGNTHRAEICIDKLFDPATAYGRQGLVELRAFEMPPHPRMVVAQMLLVRSLIAAFARSPYRAPLIRFGAKLHDRFLLPYALWRDFEDVLEYLAAAGLSLPAAGYRPFVELRCPLFGTLAAGDLRLEVRAALEPWNVLGEEVSGSGTSRYVDSSMERVEVRVHGFVPERHAVLVNGHLLPLQPTDTDGTFVAGVRFRAWAPPRSLHPHIGIHHPLAFDLVDTWAERSLGGCAYHVWHPEGRAFDAPPLTRFEADARRAQRFTLDGPRPYPVLPLPTVPNPRAPWTLDLRRLPLDRPMPASEDELQPDATSETTP